MTTITVDDLTFEVRESAHRQTLELIVDREGELVLATPSGVDEATLRTFVAEHLVGVYTKLEEKAAQARAVARKEYVPGEGFPYLGRSYRLKLVAPEDQRVPLRLFQGRFSLRRDARPEARAHFIAWYSLRLRPVLDRQLAALVERVGVRPNEVHIQELGFRWGSANRRGHLYFHWRAAMLPTTMIEYVVAHELVHLRERYHTPAFWERLERLLPDFEARRTWLAEEGGAYDL
ncbi:MAG: M48 family metallopeptidase [Anaerolineales bacterium]